MKGECCSYQTAEFGHGNRQGKKARLEKMVATTQLRLALETDWPWRQRKKEEQKMDWI